MGVIYALAPLENEQIASGSIDGTIKIWHLNSKNNYNYLKML
jgi:WD40 repeat protein